MAEPVKFVRLLWGGWRYNEWSHLSLADFFLADAASGLARYPSEVAGASTGGHSQRSLLATQLEGFARVYTILFGSPFENCTAAIVEDLRDRSPRYTTIGVDYLTARVHEQIVGAHWNIVNEDLFPTFRTAIGSPTGAMRRIQQNLGAADLRAARTPLHAPGVSQGHAGVIS
jgi:hypothetical protein